MHSFLRVLCALGALLVCPSVPAQSPAPRPASRAESPAPAPQSPTAAEEPQKRLDSLARDATLWITLRYPRDQTRNVEADAAERVQPAFRVDEAGLLLTSCAGLCAAQQVEARLPGVKLPARVQVLSVDPEHDLALLRLSESASASEAGSPAREPTHGSQPAGAPPRLGHVRVEPGTPAPFEAAGWALVWDRGQEPRAVADSSLVEAAGTSAESRRMLLATGELTRALDGWPLVDAGGRLLAIWTHAWSNSTADLEWIDARAAAALLERGRNAQPLKPAEWNAALLAQHPKSRALPRLDWMRAAAAEACAAATERAKKLPGVVLCESCDASGKQVVLGERRWDPRRERMVDTPSTTVTCRACKGLKLVSAQKIWEALRNMAIKLARVDPSRPVQETEPAARCMESALAEIFVINPAHFVGSLNDNARNELKPQKLVPGRSLAFVLPHSKWPEQDAEGWGERVRIVEGSEFGNLILSGLLLRNTVAEGSSVFLCGTVAGCVHQGGREFIVLERCFVAPIHP